VVGQRIYDSTQRSNDPWARCSRQRTEPSYVHIGSRCYHTGAADTCIACSVCIAPLATTTAPKDNKLQHLFQSPSLSYPTFFILLGLNLFLISLGHSLSGHTFSVWIVNLTAYHSICRIAVSGTCCLGAATLSQPWQTQLQRCRWRRITSLLHLDGSLDYIAISSGGSWNACAYGIG
jgi:hypothetical protein